ncbi:hypothetical protein ACFSTD_17215 [Novosphingobium colocasiae]
MKIFLERYERQSGRIVNQKTIRFYDALNAWKCIIIDLSSCLTAARDGNNHQDILLSWLATSAYINIDHMTEVLEEAMAV